MALVQPKPELQNGICTDCRNLSVLHKMCLHSKSSYYYHKLAPKKDTCDFYMHYTIPYNEVNLYNSKNSLTRKLLVL